MESAFILIQCTDHEGIVAKLSNFVFELGGNIVQSHQHSAELDEPRFFMRTAFTFDPARTSRQAIEDGLAPLAQELEAEYTIHFGSERLRMAIAVSKYDHCLLDLLYRVRMDHMPVNVACVVSNHDTLRPIAEREGFPFYHLPVSGETRRAQERQFVEIIKPESDFLVMARYMQILTQNFLDDYGKDVINIHHSFLPSFKGANPYKQAFERGVKVIGATAHFATVDLDEGPIIEQVVGRVSNKD